MCASMMTKQVLLVESSLYMMNPGKLTSLMMASEEIRVSFLYTEVKSLSPALCY
jgi:hypothetical protein